MNYNIKGTDVEVNDGLREYIEKKLQSFEKLLTRVDAARLDIVVAHHAAEGKQYFAEMTLHDAKAPLHASAHGSALQEAIDICFGELNQELSRNNKKRLSNFRHGAVKVKEFLRGWRKTI